jgi:P-type conjugative transfer protein TrbL
MLTDGNLLNNLLGTLTAAFRAYGPELLLLGTALLSVLAFLQFFYIAVDVAINHDLPHLLDSLAIALIKLGMVYVVMTHVFEWGNDIIQTGIQIGGEVSGQSPNVLTPSGIFQLGLNLVGILDAAKAEGGWLHPVQDIEFFVTAVAVAIAWLFAALLYLLLLVESSVAVFLGPVFVALGGLESTADALVAWAKTLVALAIGLIALLLTIAAGQILVQNWAVQLQAASPFITTNSYWLILTVAQSIAFFYIVKHISTMSQSMIGRSASGFAGAVLGGIGAAVSGAASAVGRAMGGNSSAKANSGESPTQSRGWMLSGNPEALTDADRQLLGISPPNSSSAPTTTP